MTEPIKELDALDRIALEAGQGEAQAEAAEQEILNPEPQVNPAEIWAQVPKMFGGILALAMPELKDAYTDKACLEWGGAMSMVADKYGWDAAETMGKWAPEIALVVATIPLALPTVAALKKRKDEAAKKSTTAKFEEARATAEDAIPRGEGTVDPH